MIRNLWYSFITLSILCTIAFVILCNIEYTVKYTYIGTCQNDFSSLSFEIIRDEKSEAFKNLKEYNIDISKNNILISRCRKIENILFDKKKLTIKTHFITIYQSSQYNEKEMYIYIIPKEEETYLDERKSNHVVIKGTDRDDVGGQ